MDTKPLERLTAALYRVTDRMADEEPLKWALRRTSLDLSQAALKNPELLSIPEEEARSKMMATLFAELIRLLELAASISYISRINFEVLIREYRHIESSIFRGGEMTLIEPEKKQEEVQEKPKEEVVAKEKKYTQTSSHREMVQPSDRQKKILEHLVAVERGISIGDLVAYFDGKISDKTIQRDLIELVSSGSIRIEGERRWRRYFAENR
ncbi:MAG: DeoR family transcriptional regulator [Patescibacteria group bacterium]